MRSKASPLAIAATMPSNAPSTYPFSKNTYGTLARKKHPAPSLTLIIRPAALVSRMKT